MISETSEAIKNLLISKLYPIHISSKDQVQLSVPKQKQHNYQIGIYLYDISSDAMCEQHYATLQEEQWTFPDKLIKASYLIYVNEEEQFGGFSKQQEELLLEAMIQLFHDTFTLMVGNQELQLQFEQRDMEVKIRLWQSFNQPLQPALYLNVSPIAISSKRKESAPVVQQMLMTTKRKE